jgi:hypothetical protein
MRGYREPYTDVHTDRQHQNIAFALMALRVLGLLPGDHGEYPPPTWLVDWRSAKAGKRRRETSQGLDVRGHLIGTRTSILFD